MANLRRKPLPWIGIVKPKLREARSRGKERVDKVEAVEERVTTEERRTRVKDCQPE